MHKITQTSLILLTLLLLLGSSPGGSPGGSSGGSPAVLHLNTNVPNPDSPEYKQLLEIRRLNGLDISIASLNKLYAEQGPNPGFAMASERFILQNNVDFENEIPALTSSLPQEHYAGVFVKSAESKIVIQLVNSTPELRAQIIKHAKFPKSLEFQEVPFTLTALRDAHFKLDPLIGSNPNLSMMGIDTKNNKITIGFRIGQAESREIRQQIEQIVDPKIINYSFNQKFTVVNQTENLLNNDNIAVIF